MSAVENKQKAVDGYAAFSNLDAEGAMKDMSDAIEWVVAGDSAITGTYTGKEAVGGFWMKLLEKGFSITANQFIAEDDKVVALCSNGFGDEKVQSVNVLSYGSDGQLVRFESFGGEELFDRTFPK
jgi:ketosteroid isomerase-like protein